MKHKGIVSIFLLVNIISGVIPVCWAFYYPQFAEQSVNIIEQSNNIIQEESNKQNITHIAILNNQQTQGFQIKYQLLNKAIIDIKIFDAKGALIKTIVSGQLREPGQYLDLWDGKDANDNNASAGAYYFLIEDSITGVSQVIYDSKAKTGLDISSAIKLQASNCNTINNQPAVLTFNLSEDALVTIAIRDEHFSGPVVRVLQDSVIMTKGGHRVYWDGRDAYGNIVEAKPYLLAIWAYSLGDKAIVIKPKIPKISQIKVNPIRLSPLISDYNTAIRPVAYISFDLSMDSYVTIKVYNSDNILIGQLLNDVFVKAGRNSLLWPGKNDFGELFAQGAYRLEIQARRDNLYSQTQNAYSEVRY